MTETDELNESIKVLTKYEKKLASTKWAFWRGVVYGFGFFIGSAILTGALFYIVEKISANGNSVLTEIIKKIVQIVRGS